MRKGVMAFSLLMGGSVLVLLASAARAQTNTTLRGKISELFIFGAGEEPLVLGGSLDPSNPANIQALAARIRARAIETRTMPLGNRTRMTDRERQLLARWLDQGAVR